MRYFDSPISCVILHFSSGGELYTILGAVGKGGNAKVFKADKISYDFDFMGTDEMTLDGNNNVALKVQIILWL